MPYNKMNRNLLGIVAALVISAGPRIAHAQDIYLSDIYGNTISVYSTNGTPVTAPLISGPTTPTLDGPFGMAISGNTLYVANWASDTVSQYNAQTGAPISSTPFISGSGLSVPSGLLLNGNNLYVANIGDWSTPYEGSIDEFNATTGALIGTGPLISGLNYTTYMALSGNNLYVSNWTSVNEYNATSGALINNQPLIPYVPQAGGLAINGNTLYVVDASEGDVTAYDATTGTKIGTKPLITGLSDPSQIVYDNGELYVSDVGTDSIHAYNATTGTEIGDQTLICGVNNPYDFIINDPDPAPVPEPKTWAMILGGLLVLVLRLRSKART